MHPAIKLLLVLLFTGFAATAKPVVLVTLAILLLVLHIAFSRQATRAALGMVWRLRYFYLSLLVVYGWFSISANPDSLMPSAQGMYMGFMRVAALVLMAWCVAQMIHTTSRQALVDGILWWFRPLAVFNDFDTRLAVRLMLVMKIFETLNADLKKQRDIRSENCTGITQWLQLLTNVFGNTLNRAEAHQPEVINIQRLQMPALSQWLIVIVFVAAISYLVVYV